LSQSKLKFVCHEIYFDGFLATIKKNFLAHNME
jgi:hypothetical protein